MPLSLFAEYTAALSEESVECVSKDTSNGFLHSVSFQFAKAFQQVATALSLRSPRFLFAVFYLMIQP